MNNQTIAVRAFIQARNIKTVYLDMDGVLNNYQLGLSLAHGYKSSTAVSQIHKEQEHANRPTFSSDFWSQCPAYSIANELVDMLTSMHVEIRILSAPLNGKYRMACVVGKQKWLEKHFPALAALAIFSRNKHQYANSDSLLIDDKAANCVRFRKYGGYTFNWFPIEM